MNVTLEDAYREACLALGESVVRERLLAAELHRHDNGQPDSTHPDRKATT